MRYLQIVLLALIFFTSLSCEDRANPPGSGLSEYDVPTIEETEIERISVYFTTPDNSADTTDPGTSPVGQALVDLMKTQTTGEMYICFYDFDYQPVINEVTRAISDGVKVYFVGDEDHQSSDEGYVSVINAITAAGGSDKETISTADSGKSGYSMIYSGASLMHNKFALITNSETGKEYVWTGSTNVTETGMNYNNNNSVVVESDDLYKIYLQQFKYLYDGSQSPVSKKQSLSVGNVTLSVQFTYTGIEETEGKEYEDLPVSSLTGLIENATTEVYFMAFSFTNTTVADSFVAARNRGITVQGIMDESQSSTNSDVLSIFQTNSVDYRIDGNKEKDPDNQLGGAKLHHKILIIDPTEYYSAAVVTGSTNFTNNANTLNAENMLIIYSRDYAEIYMEQYNSLWSEAVKRGGL
jgi:phosphatidylserine/phosphatidylglycerophosphate/cardiolipin synthase-like enzyme